MSAVFCHSADICGYCSKQRECRGSYYNIFRRVYGLLVVICFNIFMIIKTFVIIFLNLFLNFRHALSSTSGIQIHNRNINDFVQKKLTIFQILSVSNCLLRCNTLHFVFLRCGLYLAHLFKVRWYLSRY